MDAHAHVYIRRNPLRGEVGFQNFRRFFLPGSTTPLGGLSGASRRSAQKTHVNHASYVSAAVKALQCIDFLDAEKQNVSTSVSPTF